MRKSLQLQAEMTEEFGACVFDVTLDCEDGAPVGAEAQQAELIATLLLSAHQTAQAQGRAHRVAARVHPVDHPAFEHDVQTIVGRAGHALCHLMLPKVESVADIDRALAVIDTAALGGRRAPPIPLHVLIESPAAVQAAFAMAAHPRVQSVSFGLLDFVSAHGGAIPASAMGVRAAHDSQTLDQFHHPLVLRAKLEIASACHAHGKVPAHCVVAEFRDVQALGRAAQTAAQSLGYTRMWSIHPDQIRPILQAFAPSASAVQQATEVVLAAARNDWAPIAVQGRLHDRASYRYFWQVLERAHQTGRTLPQEVQGYF